MSSNALIPLQASNDKAAPGPNDADVESNIPTLQLSSTRTNGMQGPESSNSSGPPSYTRNTLLNDAFRDSEAPMEYFYPDTKGVQKSLKPAMVTHMDPPSAPMTTPIEPLPSVPTADADSFAVEVVLDRSQCPPSSLPSRPSGLKRGLQIPSRTSLITWGFTFPQVLAEQGVTKPQWKLFEKELKAFARLSVGQWVTVIACTHAVSLLFGAIVGQSPSLAGSQSL